MEQKRESVCTLRVFLYKRLKKERDGKVDTAMIAPLTRDPHLHDWSFSHFYIFENTLLSRNTLVKL